MEAVQIASFLGICAVLALIVVSILCRTTPQQKPETKQQDNTLPILPIIESRYQVQQGAQYPVNGYQQPVNYQPIQQQQAQLDAFTVQYMLQLIANQRGING